MSWLKHKKIYFGLSLTMIVVSALSLVFWGLKLGIDFKGGSILEYRFAREISTENLFESLKVKELEIVAIQTTGENAYLFKFPPLEVEQKEEITRTITEFISGESLNSGEEVVEELRFETVGPSIGPELVKKTFYAILISAGAILVWVAYQFKNFKFGASAILAMLHDSFILIGAFSVLGHFWAVETDFLFITALLTTLSFSVHDTIVVFDRIREIEPLVRRTSGPEGADLAEISNQALTETMVRSLNNSFTIAFMLLALILMGGATIKWFAAALFIGTILGTYSSPFVAVPLLVSWDGVVEKAKTLIVRRKGK